MDKLVHELLDLLQLEQLENNIFRGESRDIGTKYVFGGQVVGQAISAAQSTVDDARDVHSLHGYFLRAGEIDRPIVYQVERTRDGGSFSVRRVTAIQNGKPIFVMATSFQRPEEGKEHQIPMPSVPFAEELEPPEPYEQEQLQKLPPKIRRWLERGGPFEFRPVHPRDEFNPQKQPPYQHVWLKLQCPVDVSPLMHRALLAYASDFHLIGTTTFPHGLSYWQPNVLMASLDHAMWFHRPFRADEWLLYSCDSPTAQGGRGLARGGFYNQAGELVASTAQEGLIRVLDDNSGKKA